MAYATSPRKNSYGFDKWGSTTWTCMANFLNPTKSTKYILNDGDLVLIERFIACNDNDVATNQVIDSLDDKTVEHLIRDVFGQDVDSHHSRDQLFGLIGEWGAARLAKEFNLCVLNKNDTNNQAHRGNL